MPNPAPVPSRLPNLQVRFPFPLALFISLQYLSRLFSCIFRLLNLILILLCYFISMSLFYFFFYSSCYFLYMLLFYFFVLFLSCHFLYLLLFHPLFSIHLMSFPLHVTFYYFFLFVLCHFPYFFIVYSFFLFLLPCRFLILLLSLSSHLYHLFWLTYFFYNTPLCTYLRLFLLPLTPFPIYFSSSSSSCCCFSYNEQYKDLQKRLARDLKHYR